MSRILYLHGFASCAEGNKSSALKAYFNIESVVSPDLPVCPIDAMNVLEEILKSLEFDLLVGSSLGGFYATCLSEKYAIKTVLLNPSTRPWETLAPYVGWQKRFCDEEVFEFKSVYLEQLKMLKVSPEKGRYLLLLQSGDEVLDYTKAQSLYSAHRVVVEYGGNHRFENIEDYLCMIENFKNK